MPRLQVVIVSSVFSKVFLFTMLQLHVGGEGA